MLFQNMKTMKELSEVRQQIIELYKVLELYKTRIEQVEQKLGTLKGYVYQKGRKTWEETEDLNNNANMFPSVLR